MLNVIGKICNVIRQSYDFYVMTVNIFSRVHTVTHTDIDKTHIFVHVIYVYRYGCVCVCVCVCAVSYTHLLIIINVFKSTINIYLLVATKFLLNYAYGQNYTYAQARVQTVICYQAHFCVKCRSTCSVFNDGNAKSCVISTTGRYVVLNNTCLLVLK